MKITKKQLKRIIKEELEKEYSPAVEITAMAESISYLIHGSVMIMVRRGDPPDAIIEQLSLLARWAREISAKAKTLPRNT